MKPWQKLLAGGASALIVAGAIGAHYEGTRLQAYPDSGGVWTICRGHTQGVKPGDVATIEQCDAWQSADIAHANAGVRACIHQPITRGQKVALTDWAYNVGVPAACGSTLVRMLNAGEPASAWCAQLMRWVHAGGKVLPGLVKRRAAEREICLEGAN